MIIAAYAAVATNTQLAMQVAFIRYHECFSYHQKLNCLRLFLHAPAAYGIRHSLCFRRPFMLYSPLLVGHVNFFRRGRD